MALTKVQGVILKGMNLGENDKIVTIYTDKLGKIKMVAHGAKKPKSRLMASTQPFCYGEYIIYKGKSLYTLNESTINESFQSILLDFNNIIYGSYFLELIDILTEDENKNTSILAFLLKTLYILSDGNTELDLLRLTFDLKAVSLSGYMPDIRACIKCGECVDFGYFSIAEGGLICSKCGEQGKYVYGINKETLSFLRILKNIKLENLRNINYDVKNIAYLQDIITKYIDYHIDKPIKSRDVLQELL